MKPCKICGKPIPKRNSTYCSKKCSSSDKFTEFNSRPHRTDCPCALCQISRGVSYVKGKHWRLSTETKLRQSLGNKNKPKSLSHRQATSKGVKTLWQDEGYRNRVILHSSWGQHGHYDSKKNDVSIIYQSSYELRAFEILEADPNVKRYGRCRFSIPYFLNGEVGVYHPDIFVEYLDGHAAVIEVKAAWELEHPNRRQEVLAKALATEDYCFELGFVYLIWTERSLGL